MRTMLKCLLFIALIAGLAGEAKAQKQYNYKIMVTNAAWFNIRTRPTVVVLSGRPVPYAWSNTIRKGHTGEHSFSTSVWPHDLKFVIEVEYHTGFEWKYLCKEEFGPASVVGIEVHGDLFNKRCQKFYTNDYATQ